MTETKRKRLDVQQAIDLAPPPEMQSMLLVECGQCHSLITMSARKFHERRVHGIGK